MRWRLCLNGAKVVLRLYPARIIGQSLIKSWQSGLKCQWLWTPSLWGLVEFLWRISRVFGPILFYWGIMKFKKNYVWNCFRQREEKIVFTRIFRTGISSLVVIEDVTTIGEVMGYGMFALMNSTLLRGQCRFIWWSQRSVASHYCGDFTTANPFMSRV